MNCIVTTLLIWLVAVVVSLPLPVAAQGSAPAAEFKQELDQLFAPIALYPDALLVQILMASTYRGRAGPPMDPADPT